MHYFSFASSRIRPLYFRYNVLLLRQLRVYMTTPSNNIKHILDQIDYTLFQDMQRGIERESLRMQANGFLSQQTHPIALGAALTHPTITTDYSEALLEFITPPTKSITDTLSILKDIHSFTYQHLPEGESLWSLSMPCMLDSQDENIPIAQYGTSNLGQFKTLYRKGLAVRYGRRMQTISGVHYNLSFPDELFATLQQQESDLTLKNLSLQDYRSHRYFGLIRNFLRQIPLVIYLLGASPSICRCFVTGREHNLQELVKGTMYLPHATALRMGKLGYQNSAQRKLGIHYNNLSGYLAGIREATQCSYPEFTALGLDDADGNPIQINDHVLQIENEYYSVIRPKQTPQAGESPSDALQARGVAYVELRAVDVNPFSPIGINADTASFLETLALYCLLSDSPEIDEAEQAMLDRNQLLVVERGREPQLQIEQPTSGDATTQVDFQTWIQQQLDAMQPCASILDQALGQQAPASNTLYQSAWALMQARSLDSSKTLSAQMLKQTTELGGTWAFGANLAAQYQEYYQSHTLSADTQQQFEQAATESLKAQQQLEAQTHISFQDYLKPYRRLTEQHSCVSAIV